MNSKLFYLIGIYLICLILPSLAYGQDTLDFPLAVTVTDMSGPQTATINLPDATALSIKLNATDADYDAEGDLYINDKGPIKLFPGGNAGNNDIPSSIVIKINGNDYFNAGTNTLRFEYKEQDGYQITGMTVVRLIKNIEYTQVNISLDTPISGNRKKALQLYKRLAGVGTPIDNPVLIQMEQQLNAGNSLGAAEIATMEPSFYNLVVRDFAARMSTREETINETLNDFTTTVIGVTRDEIDARELLTGNFIYKGSPATAVSQNMATDMLESNRHYQELESESYDLASVLVKQEQQLLTPSKATVRHPDSAGVLTSRAFMGAHALDGTNRRLVEYTFKQFTCNDMEDWADATATDLRIGRDIDRFPGGEAGKFLTTCKACHSVMDGFRGAFARYDFDRNYIKHTSIHANNEQRQDPMGVDRKMNANSNTFQYGYRTTDDTWVNNARSPANVQRFGWRGVVSSGAGVRSFGRTIANTKAFSKCITKKVYRELCKRPVANFESYMVDQMSTEFESSGYNLKRLFQKIAVRPECLGGL